MKDIIVPRLLKGFRDLLPHQALLRQQIIDSLMPILGYAGFVPIDTPLLEYSEILLGKGGGETEKQIYRFSDQGGRDVSLRFDLTIPLARFVAQHAAELLFPLRCYHVGKVFRGENPQKGRYREFTQFDFDIIGTNSILTDFEILQLVIRVFATFNIPIRIHFSHHDLIPLFINTLHPNQTLTKSILPLRIIIDKLPKTGISQAKKDITELLPADERPHVDRLLEFIQLGHRPVHETLAYINDTLRATDTPEASRVCRYFSTIIELSKIAGFDHHLVLAPHITRGLDYYTSLIFETFATTPGIGSLCSGGRYNNLTSLYTQEKYEGVGASIGIDRLLMLDFDIATTTAKPEVLILTENHSETEQVTYAHRLHNAGVHCEIYPTNEKLKVQFQYAEHKQIPHSFKIPKIQNGDSLELRNHHVRASIYFQHLESVITFLKLYRLFPDQCHKMYTAPPEINQFDFDALVREHTTSPIHLNWQPMIKDLIKTHNNLH